MEETNQVVSHAKQEPDQEIAAAVTTPTLEISKPVTTVSTEAAAKPEASSEANAGAKMQTVSRKLELAPIAVPSALMMVPVALIETRAQVRTEFVADTIKELADDIAVRGMLQPILLRSELSSGNFIVIAGERRLRAAKLVGMDTVPAIVGEVSSEVAHDMQLAENIQREDLSLRDLASAVRKIYEKNKSITATAEILKKSKSWVSKHVAASCPDLQQIAKDLLNNGLTEDLEILLMVDKMQAFDYSAAEDIYQKIKSGNASRQTVKEAYEAAKAKSEKRGGFPQVGNGESGAGNEVNRRLLQANRDVEKLRHAERLEIDPVIICKKVIENAELEQTAREELPKEQLAILETHLLGFFKEARAERADRHAYRIIDMQYNDFLLLEIAAYVAGITWEKFDLRILISQTNQAIFESIS